MSVPIFQNTIMFLNQQSANTTMEEIQTDESETSGLERILSLELLREKNEDCHKVLDYTNEKNKFLKELMRSQSEVTRTEEYLMAKEMLDALPVFVRKTFVYMTTAAVYPLRLFGRTDALSSMAKHVKEIDNGIKDCKEIEYLLDGYMNIKGTHQGDDPAEYRTAIDQLVESVKEVKAATRMSVLYRRTILRSYDEQLGNLNLPIQRKLKKACERITEAFGNYY